MNLMMKMTKLPTFEMMVVMLARLGRLIPGTSIAKIMSINNVGDIEHSQRAIDGCDADARIDFRGPLIHRFDIGMVDRVRQHARNDAALLGHLHAFFDTGTFDIRDRVALTAFFGGIRHS